MSRKCIIHRAFSTNRYIYFRRFNWPRALYLSSSLQNYRSYKNIIPKYPRPRYGIQYTQPGHLRLSNTTKNRAREPRTSTSSIRKTHIDLKKSVPEYISISAREEKSRLLSRSPKDHAIALEAYTTTAASLSLSLSHLAPIHRRRRFLSRTQN